MNRAFLLCLAVCLSGAYSCMSAGSQARMATLVTSYYRYLMSGELDGYCTEIASKATEEQKKEISESLAEIKTACITRIRKDLRSEFGDEAQGEFAAFIAAYTSAAKDGNAEYRAGLAAALGITPVPGSYDALRNKAMGALMQKDIEMLSRFLGDIEMWIGLQKKVKAPPALKAWLHRADVMQEEDRPGPAAPADRKTRSLRDAEVDSSGHQGEAGEDVNPMDAFSDLKKAKRQRAMEEAKAGMQQVAQEREAAEREEAARKQEAASAEAEAMKAQANKIAAVEKEAIEQSKNTWGNRLKNILGATVSAAGGAFFGGIGARAGQEAVDAVFNKK